jgi:hypothetical protein
VASSARCGDPLRPAAVTGIPAASSFLNLTFDESGAQLALTLRSPRCCGDVFVVPSRAPPPCLPSQQCVDATDRERSPWPLIRLAYHR